MRMWHLTSFPPVNRDVSGGVLSGGESIIGFGAHTCTGGWRGSRCGGSGKYLRAAIRAWRRYCSGNPAVGVSEIMRHRLVSGVSVSGEQKDKTDLQEAQESEISASNGSAAVNDKLFLGVSWTFLNHRMIEHV